MEKKRDSPEKEREERRRELEQALLELLTEDGLLHTAHRPTSKHALSLSPAAHTQAVLLSERDMCVRAGIPIPSHENQSSHAYTAYPIDT